MAQEDQVKQSGQNDNAILERGHKLYGDFVY
jgi:hypothetical protein